MRIANVAPSFKFYSQNIKILIQKKTSTQLCENLAIDSYYIREIFTEIAQDAKLQAIKSKFYVNLKIKKKFNIFVS